MEIESEDSQFLITYKYNPQPVTGDQNGEGYNNISSRKTPRTSAARRRFQPQETAASTLIKYIINKNKTTATPRTPIHPFGAFFGPYCPNFKILISILLELG
jgi:hypothetical protein